LNVAWGSILSEVDILLLKDDKLTYIEVKSRKDKISKALQQIGGVKDYVDFAYVATNKLLKEWNIPEIGLIYVQNNEVTLVKEPTRFRDRPRFTSIVSLKKKCLTRFLGNGRACRTYVAKYDLAKYVYIVRKNECTRECLKEIVTCGSSCDGICPIAKFVNGN